MPRLALVLGAALACTELGAQTPGTAVPSALRSLLTGMGGCHPDQIDTVTAAIPYFPTVRFTRGRCVLEHGDSTSAIVGLDSDSVLYLLATREAFNFLVDRHTPVGLTDHTLTYYAMAALELSGSISANARLVQTVDDLPTAARAARSGLPGHPVRLSTSPIAHLLLLTVTPSFDGPIVTRHEVHLSERGRLIFAADSVIWQASRTDAVPPN